MRLGKRYSRKIVIMAMIHGILIGIAGVLIFGFVLNIGNKLNDDTNGQANELAVNAPISSGDTNEKIDENSVVPNNVEDLKLHSFFAFQHGVFTSQEAATAFISTEPTLQTAAIIPIDSKYYVWSAIGLTETEARSDAIMTADSFVKNFFVNSAQCTKKGYIELPELLKITDVQKLNFGDTANLEDFPEKWAENVAAVTAFSKDIRIVRSQLLAHYSKNNECLKIEF